MTFAESTVINSAALALTKLVYGVKICDAIALISKIAFFFCFLK
jgi:hypothetical protein